MVVAAVILLLRKTDSFINPQFWAEDFWPFFIDADLYGADVIFRSYNGYSHFAPRLIAWISSCFDPLYQPALYLAFSLVLTISVVAHVLSDRFNIKGKEWLALAIVAVPHTGEVFLNPTNIQWVLALGYLIIVFKDDPRSPTQWLSDLFWLIFITLTGPFGVLFCPFLLLRAWRRGTIGSVVLALAAILPAGFQAWQLFHAAEIAPTAAWKPLGLIGMLSVRIPVTFLFGPTLSFKLGFSVALIIGIMSAIFIAIAVFRKTASKEIQVQLLIAIIIVLVAISRRSRPDTWAFDDIVNGDRYLYIPKVLALWLFTIVYNEMTRKFIKIGMMAAAALGFVANIPTFRIQPLPDMKWSNYCDQIRAGQKVVVPTNPGWTWEYPGNPRKIRDK